MRSRLLLTVLWVLATLAATVMAVRGVGVVSHNLSGGRTQPLSAGQLDERLHDLGPTSTVPGATSTTVTTEPSTTTIATTEPATTPLTTGTTALPGTTEVTRATAPTTTRAPVASTAKPCKAYAKSTAGGTLFVTGCPGTVRFEGAQPAAGWVLAEQEAEGGEVKVSFRRSGGEGRYDVQARATASGVPSFEVHTDGGSGGGGDD